MIEPRFTSAALSIPQMVSSVEEKAYRPSARVVHDCAAGKDCAHYRDLGKPYPNVHSGDYCRRCQVRQREALIDRMVAVAAQKRAAKKKAWTRERILAGAEVWWIEHRRRISADVLADWRPEYLPPLSVIHEAGLRLDDLNWHGSTTAKRLAGYDNA